MKRGVCFRILENDGAHIGQLFQPIGFSSYCWKVDREETFDQHDASLLPSEDFIKGEVIECALADGDAFYINFLDLKAFAAQQEAEEITTYEDFVSSRCEIMIFITDGTLCEIYAKDQDLLKRLYKKAHDRHCKGLEYVTEENDGRTRMTVW